MKIRFKKVIAVIATLSLLCGMIALNGIIPASASANNLVVNGGFETDDMSAWAASSYMSVSSQVSHSGEYSLFIDAGSAYATLAALELDVSPNTDYTFGIWYTYTAEAAGPSRIYFQDGALGSDSSYEALAAANGGDQPILYFSNGKSTDGVWTQDIISFNSGSNDKIWLKFSGGSKGVTPVYIDDLTCEEKEDLNYVGTAQREMSEKADVRIMTYNLLVDNVDFSWGTKLDGRPEGAIGCIKYYAPDVIGIQEASKGWYEEFENNLPNYEFVNSTCLNREYNNCTGMMYNTDTVNLIATDLMLYSVYNSDRMRYVNMGMFEVKETGEQFIVISTHFDAGKERETQRCTQAAELVQKIKEYERIYGCPIISVGDYNCGVGEDPYEHIVANLTDADEDITAGVIDHLILNTKARSLYHTVVMDAAVAHSSDHRPVFADIEFLEGTTYSVKQMERLIKTQGRTRFEGDTLMLDYSASGIEFKANCKGDVFVTFDTQYLKDKSSYGGCYFTVVVDGVTSARDTVWITKEGPTEVCIAKGLESGTHTFAIYRQTELRAAEIGISKFRFDGRFLSKPKDNPIYIEFIGDSITCAYGNLGQDGVSVNVDSPLHQDATQGYAYITAKNLNADFSLVSYSGIGAKYGYNGFDMPVFYPAQAYPYDTSAYNFEKRQPDIVVIALGTNDSNNAPDKTEMKKGFDELLVMVREKNPKAKIVWIYGMMTNDVDKEIVQAVADAGGAVGGYYAVKLSRDNGGAGWHPSLSGQQKFAEELTKYLTDSFVKVPTIRGITDGKVIDLRTDRAPTLMWDIGTGVLNGEAIEKPLKLKEPGEYTLTVTNLADSTTVKFTIVDSSVEPTVSGVKNGETYDLYRDKALTLTWDVGDATLNGNDVESGVVVNEAGEYLLVVKDGTKSVEISFNVVDTTPPVKKGDPDGDGEITVADALAALRIAAKMAQPDELTLLWGDIDADGEVTVADALAILRVAAKMSDSL